MTFEQVNNTLKFLQDAPLKGGDAPVFMDCVAALQIEAQRLKQIEDQDNAK